jgi:nitrile hydratase subunit beta
MDGIHDMGGMHGFGKIEPEANEPVFHSPWEGRVLAMTRAMVYTGAWTIDQSRAAGEKLPPQEYLSISYYKRWQLALETNVIENGLVGGDEIAAGHALRAGRPLRRKLLAAEVPNTITRGSYARPASAPARFKVGDRVHTRNIHPETHTRLPRYARGRNGVIDAIRGCHVFPDTVAIGAGEDPQWLYTVLFEARELWGDSADPTLKVSVEAFEPYLEPAS